MGAARPLGGAPDLFRAPRPRLPRMGRRDRKSTRLNSSHRTISYAVFCLKKKNNQNALGLLEQCAPPECALEMVVLGEPLQLDGDRALQLFGVPVDDVGENNALGRLAYEW